MIYTNLVAFRLEVGQLRELQQFADERGISFSEAVRHLLYKALEAEKG